MSDREWGALFWSQLVDFEISYKGDRFYQMVLPYLWDYDAVLFSSTM